MLPPPSTSVLPSRARKLHKRKLTRRKKRTKEIKKKGTPVPLKGEGVFRYAYTLMKKGVVLFWLVKKDKKE